MKSAMKKAAKWVWRRSQQEDLCEEEVCKVGSAEKKVGYFLKNGVNTWVALVVLWDHNVQGFAKSENLGGQR